MKWKWENLNFINQKPNPKKLKSEFLNEEKYINKKIVSQCVKINIGLQQPKAQKILYIICIERLFNSIIYWIHNLWTKFDIQFNNK